MFSGINKTQRAMQYAYRLLGAVVLLMTFISGTGASPGQKSFATPEDAVRAFVTSLKSDNEEELLSIFGKDGKSLIFSGDPVSDKQRREKFISDFDQKNSIVQEGAKMVLVIGDRDWPFPVPLAKKGERWIFDTRAGKEEILDRRIGENEYSTVETLMAIVDAQREYAMNDSNANRVREYAETFMSDPGQKNGLYWKTKEGEKQSPLGELVADAQAEGYSSNGARQGPIAFHGYYFRMLKKQGKHAPGGAYDYIVNNQMIGGFAVVAYPAAYGSSGVMTFIVNHRGVVYEKNLGKDTVKIASALASFDPDDTWKKVE
ncbi:MAG: DUF2950 domain-containing protein [Desulfobacterales bacterium]